MKTLFPYTLFFLVSIFFGNCTQKQIPADNHLVSITTHSPIFPVLIGKENNPIFRINILPKSGQPLGNIQAFTIDLSGTTTLSDINKAKIFYTTVDKGFSSDTLFAETTKIAEKIKLSGTEVLQTGNNYFWLSLTLNDQANLDDVVNGVISEVVIDKSIVAAGVPTKSTVKKIGHALRQHMDDEVHTYRIPGLVTTNNGTLIAVYDIRRNGSVDLQEDIDIGMNRSTDGGQTWEPMKVIMDMGEWGGKPQNENGIGDPSVLVDKQTNTIWVAAIWAHGHPGKRNWWASKPGIKPELTSQLMLAKSEDDGLTWSDPINITPEVKDPKWYLILQGPGRGITMKDGTLVFPAQYKDEEEMPHSTILYSQDQGATWQLGTGAKSNTTEAQVVELSDGSLMLNMRDNRGSGPNGKGFRSVVITKDLGKTWAEHPSSRKALIEPVCNAGLLKHTYQEKDILIFINPNDQYSRRNMTIKISMDEGMTWPEQYQMLIDEGQGRGYPSLTTIDERTIGILYEGSQADLVFQKFNLASIKK